MSLAAAFVGTLSLVLACVHMGIATTAEYRTMESLQEVPDDCTRKRACLLTKPMTYPRVASGNNTTESGQVVTDTPIFDNRKHRKRIKHDDLTKCPSEASGVAHSCRHSRNVPVDVDQAEREGISKESAVSVAQTAGISKTRSYYLHDKQPGATIREIGNTILRNTSPCGQLVHLNTQLANINSQKHLGRLYSVAASLRGLDPNYTSTIALDSLRNDDGKHDVPLKLITQNNLDVSRCFVFRNDLKERCLPSKRVEISLGTQQAITITHENMTPDCEIPDHSSLLTDKEASNATSRFDEPRLVQFMYLLGQAAEGKLYNTALAIA